MLSTCFVAALILASLGFLAHYLAILAWSSEVVLLCCALAVFEFVILGMSVSFMAQLLYFFSFHVKQVCEDMLKKGNTQASSRWLDLLWSFFWGTLLLCLFLLQYMPLSEALEAAPTRQLLPVVFCYYLNWTVFGSFALLAVVAVWLRLVLRLQFPPSLVHRLPPREVRKLTKTVELADCACNMFNRLDFMDRLL